MKRRCVFNPGSRAKSDASVKLRHCREADTEHERSFRQYAHTFHYPNTVCFAEAFCSLSERWQLAILLHELGHLLAGYKGSEAAANAAIEKATGVHIHYKDGHFGKRLEWITAADVPAAKRAIEGVWS
jgi:hypothetical protein